MNSYNTAKTYIIPTAAAGGLTLQMRGVYIFIASATENLNIQVFDEDNNQIGDIEDFESGLGQPFSGGFSKIVVTTASGGAGSAALAIGTDMATFTALTGTVNVIDQTSHRALALAMTEYTCAFSLGGTAADSSIQLRNPAASGKIAILKKLRMTVTTNTNGKGGFIATAADLATIGLEVGNRYSGAVGPAAVFSMANVGVAAPIQLRSALPATTDAQLEEMELGIIAPGYAFQYGTSTTNQSLVGLLVWEERTL